jgi:hypothetical protein
MSSSIVVTFTNEVRHVFGLGDFQRWETEGIRGRFLKGKDPQGGREGRPIEDAIIAHPILYLRDGVGFFRTDLHGGRRAFFHVKARRIKFLLPYQIHKKEQVHKIWFCVPVTFKDKRRHVSALQQ